MDLLLIRRLFRGVTQYLVRWQWLAPPADAWRRVEEQDPRRDLMAGLDAIAPTRRAARHAARAAVAVPRPAPVPGPAVLDFW